jgi:hypothetical protein
MHTETTASRRSVFRLRNLILTVVAGLLIWIVITVSSVVSQKSGVPGKFTATINQMVADAQAETAGEANGWPLVIRAAEIYDRVAKPLAERPLPEGFPATIHPPLSGDMVAWPDANDVVRREVAAMITAFEREGLFEKLDDVVSSRRFVRELPQGKMIDVMIPELGAMRGMARLCRAQMFFAAEAKDGQAFVRAARRALTLGNAAAEQATMMDRLVGASIDVMTCLAIADAIRDHGLDEATCRSLMDLLADRTGFDATLGLKIEYLSAQDTVEWTHSDDGDGDGRFMPGQASVLPLGASRLPSIAQNLAGLLAPSKRQTLDAFENLFGVGIEQSAKALRDRDPNAFETTLGTYSDRYKIVHILMPAVDRYITLSSGHDLRLVGTRAMLAVELHKHSKGSYPARLEDLETEWRDAVDAPPWGAELRYKPLADGDDEDRRAYLLYWIGIDGTDDGGRVDRLEGSQGAWRPKKKGVDFVFNEPMEKPNREGGGAEGAGK